MSQDEQLDRGCPLSAQSDPVVRATASVVAEHAEQITGCFYPRMFAAQPELLRLFNQGNQATGEQSQALAASVVAFALHLIDPQAPSFDHVMTRIAHKHVSLGVEPEQYLIVGRHLMAAVGEVLGDAVDQDVANAWDEVYWLFATALIAAEAKLYERANVDPGRSERPYRVVRRITETPDVISLVLEPADDRDFPRIAAGQYVSVHVDLPGGQRQPRQYTVVSTGAGGRVQITVRRVRGVAGAPDGQVSSHLHDHVQVGDLLDVGPPSGDVVLQAGDAPLLLVSAGVGITPVAAILEHVVRTQPGREVIVAHADRSAADHALRATVAQLGDQIDHFTSHAWYESVDPDDQAAHQGDMELADFPLPPDVVVFTCGPLPFMRQVRSALLARGVPAANIRYEVFGPDLWATEIDTPAAVEV